MCITESELVIPALMQESESGCTTSELIDFLYADLDLSTISANKRVVGITGHYSRPDVFDYKENR